MLCFEFKKGVPQKLFEKINEKDELIKIYNSYILPLPQREKFKRMNSNTTSSSSSSSNHLAVDYLEQNLNSLSVYVYINLK